MQNFKQWVESIYDGGTIQDKGLFELFRNIKLGDRSAINQFHSKLANMHLDLDKRKRSEIFKDALNSAIQTGNGWNELESELFWLLKRSEKSI
jgi:hypothetical protein